MLGQATGFGGGKGGAGQFTMGGGAGQFTMGGGANGGGQFTNGLGGFTQSGKPAPPDTTNETTNMVMVMNVPSDKLTIMALNAGFQQYGTITNVQVMADRNYAVLTFSSDDAAKQVVDAGKGGQTFLGSSVVGVKLYYNYAAIRKKQQMAAKGLAAGMGGDDGKGGKGGKGAVNGKGGMGMGNSTFMSNQTLSNSGPSAEARKAAEETAAKKQKLI